ncbi:hypothetical protein B0I35DRAFT_262872 [Stachybotrys elegans]|uniref:Uncharacterized protein n=1 Tax=Stachybotrys elegans TaxID=80388 RepID=A0A8K0SNH0_9HYPO|nr:hypothetical protein B0I35DRAFT_262872 [Stachybotrys elegans]
MSIATSRHFLSGLSTRLGLGSSGYQTVPDAENGSGSRNDIGILATISAVAVRIFKSARWSAAILLFILGIAYITSGLVSLNPAAATPAWHRNDEAVTSDQIRKLNVPTYKPESGGDRRLRIFMPADTPHINLCKAIMSAAALGYPMPTLLNWDGEFNRPEWHFAGSHIAKLESLLAGIEAVLDGAEGDDDVGEDDIAVLVDAYDIWFQLPPAVLIQRFLALNEQANDRLRHEWRDLVQKDAPDFPIPPPRQNIIVTTAKDCEPGPESGSNPHYDHWPQSPMPADMYGEGTDKILDIWDAARKYKNIRPRCVNSGMIMGTMGALRDSLLRAKEKIETVALSGRQLWSDQALYAEVIGDQELWREWVRSMIPTWNGTGSTVPGNISSDVRPVARAALQGKRFEFGIGLDYNFTTIPATCSAEEDGYFVHLNDKKAVEEESRKAGVPGDARVSGIPTELAKGAPHSEALKGVDWGAIPLYTDFFFGVTPVGIHHNAYVGGLKTWRVQNWWSLMWFYPKLRDLVTANLRPLGKDERPSPLVELPAPYQGGQKLAYWESLASRRTRKVTVFEPKTASTPARFRPIEWDGVCQKGSKPWYETLFGDGKGPLVL